MGPLLRPVEHTIQPGTGVKDQLLAAAVTVSAVSPTLSNIRPPVPGHTASLGPQLPGLGTYRWYQYQRIESPEVTSPSVSLCCHSGPALGGKGFEKMDVSPTQATPSCESPSTALKPLGTGRSA